MATISEDSWGPLEFNDDSECIVAESDPWDPMAGDVEPPSSADCHSQISVQPSALVSNLPPTDEEATQYTLSEKLDTSYESSSIDDEFDVPNDWFVDVKESDHESEALDRPEPIHEFNPDLSEHLYEILESIDLSDVDVRLDQFLANVGLSAADDLQIRTQLKDFSKARLSNWLPWLTCKAWTGRSLLRFVQFHNCWESSPEWWESRWYMWRYGWLRPRSTMSNILGREDAYWMVHRRINHSPEEIIDTEWFDEWDYYSLWRHGFYSFAKFAKFRSGLNEGEDWKSLIAWRIYTDDKEPYYRVDRTIDWVGDVLTVDRRTAHNCVPQSSHTSSLAGWYSIQDWHPEREWHDHLGWNIPSVGFADTNVSAKTWQGPLWPIGGRNE